MPPTTDRRPALDGAADPTEIPREAWLALLVSTIVVFFVVIDISAVNVAFPSIRSDFEASESQLSWVISAYNVTVEWAWLFVAAGLALAAVVAVVMFPKGSSRERLAPAMPNRTEEGAQ